MAKESIKRKTVSLAIKRICDVLFAVLLLVILALPAAIIALVAAIDTKASPWFSQIRVGRYGKQFRMYKFRTMTPDAPRSVATYLLKNADSYITPFGRFLRRSSIDEMPQLINVLRGEMSFIGPRPVVPQEEKLLRLRERAGALQMRPGMTGWAQIHGRDRVTISEKAKMDGEYVNHYSIGLDLKILLMTAGYVFRSPNDVVEGKNDAVLKTRKSHKKGSRSE